MTEVSSQFFRLYRHCLALFCQGQEIYTTLDSRWGSIQTIVYYYCLFSVTYSTEDIGVMSFI